jgi:hypothetical protein
MSVPAGRFAYGKIAAEVKLGSASDLYRQKADAKAVRLMPEKLS